MATTDIKLWLASVDFDSDAEIYALYKTMEEGTSYSPFVWVEQNVHNGKRCYLSCPHISDSLLLVSDSAIAEFLRQLHGYMEGYTRGMSIDDWYNFRNSQEN